MIKDLDSYRAYYFLGIGGIGMSAIARYLHEMGHHVSGYDKVRSGLCLELEAEGMNINYTDTLEMVSMLNMESTLIIYTPAIPKDCVQYQFFKSQAFDMLKRSEILGLLTKNTYNISVAGTHGKTTTSCLISHILNTAKHPFTAFLGGISTNLESNYFSRASSQKEPLTVTEADEFDRSFLTLFPNLAIVTSMDADHLDVYGDDASLRNSFFDFIKNVKAGGSLYLKHGLPLPHTQNIKVQTYGIEQGDYQARNIRIQNMAFVFDFESPDHQWTNLRLGLPGSHNIENALAAIAIALELGIDRQTIVSALETFSGVKRRFEYIVKKPPFVFIDDYAHHPNELSAFINSVRMLYPDEVITGVFQPHLYSRTRDFAKEFAKSLSLLDVCILLEIYPARELPIPGVSSKIIFDQLQSVEKYECTKDTLLPLLNKLKPKLLLTIGAGDIDTLIPYIAKSLAK